LGDKQKSYIFIGIERNGKFAFAKVYQNKTIETSAEFLTEYIEKMPFKIHTILTDNGMEYTFNLYHFNLLISNLVLINNH